MTLMFDRACTVHCSIAEGYGKSSTASQTPQQTVQAMLLRCYHGTWNAHRACLTCTQPALAEDAA